MLGHLFKTDSFRLFALRNGPELDSCSKACASLYSIALSALFSGADKGGGDVARKAVEVLRSETGPGTASFRISLAVFLRRQVYPSSTKESAQFSVTQAIRALESGKI
jgi:hypothetical protein